MFVKCIEVSFSVFASSSPRKKWGSDGKGKVPMLPLSNFSDFFKKIAIVVTFKAVIIFKAITFSKQTRFSKQFEKTKYRKS